MKKALLAFGYIIAASFAFTSLATAEKLVIAWTAVSAFNSPFWVMSADFIVLDANPLDDITNTRRISSVILRGAVVDRTQPVR